jgi:hypothetical protein
MNSSIQQNSNRVIELDLELYTDGDPDLKRELIILMIDNIRELQQSLQTNINDIDVFKKISHKVKPTISMLNDKELTDAIEDIKTIDDQEKKNERVNSFQRLCNDIIQILEKENDIAA